jgi:hypothetical protein
MHRIALIALFSVLLTGIIPGVELLENGDFESDLSLGWIQNLGGSNYEIDRDTLYHLDPDHEAYVEKFLQVYCALEQTVPVVGLDLLFTAEARFDNFCQENPYEFFAASAVRLEYLDDTRSVLGETRIYNGTVYCDWASSSELHLIEVTDDRWHEFSLLIQDEMEHLPSVDPAEVHSIRVGLYSFNTESC